MTTTLPAREQVRSLLTRQIGERDELLAAGVRTGTVAELYPVDFEYFVKSLMAKLSRDSSFLSNLGERLTHFNYDSAGNWEAFYDRLPDNFMVEHHREYNRAAGSDRVLSPLYELVLEGLTKTHENFATRLAFFYIRGVFMAYWLLAHEAELQVLSREADAIFAQISALLVPSAAAGD